MLTDSAKERLEKAARDFKNGNQQAFDVIFDLAADAVFRICRYISGSFHEAEDLMQEVFIRVYSSLPDFREDSSFFTWLYAIARNTSLNYVRKQSGRETMLVDHDTFPEPEVAEASDKSNKNEELNLMRSCIQELQPMFRSIILLKDIEGLSYEDIARIESIPIGTVRSRLNRGRTILKEIFFRKRGT